MIKKLVLFTFLGFSSCDDGSNVDQRIVKDDSIQKDSVASTSHYYHQSEDRPLVDSLLERALTHGDTRAYNTVASYFRRDVREQEFLYYALTMANEHNDPEACFHVFDAIAYSSPDDFKVNLVRMSSQTRAIAIYYLLRSHEQGFSSATTHLMKLYPDSASFPTSSSYWQDTGAPAFLSPR